MLCHRCNCECERTGQRQKYCPACSKAIDSERRKAHREANLEAVRAKDRLRTDPEKNRQRTREWAAKNPERAKAQARNTYEKNKQRAIDRAAKWNAENVERRRQITNASARRRRAEEPEKFREAKRRRRAIPAVRLHDNISSYMWICLKKNKAGAPWESLVGFTLAELMAHLEAQFVDGMTWETYGKWHIDHKRPVVSFEFSSPTDEGFKQCWALSNLQPLWAADNIKKNSHWNGERVFRRRTEVNQAVTA